VIALEHSSALYQTVSNSTQPGLAFGVIAESRMLQGNGDSWGSLPVRPISTCDPWEGNETAQGSNPECLNMEFGIYLVSIAVKFDSVYFKNNFVRVSLN